MRNQNEYRDNADGDDQKNIHGKTFRRSRLHREKFDFANSEHTFYRLCRPNKHTVRTYPNDAYFNCIFVIEIATISGQ